MATSISVAPTPRDPAKGKIHELEWHVKEFQVGFGPMRKTILHDIAGKTKSGELTAIMGPSGAGKTTLLDAISLRNRHFHGAVHYNGKPPDGEFFTVSVLVHQKELLFGFMTPREHLIFHAIARMAKKYKLRDIEERVDEVLREVKLEKCANTIVGGTDPIYMKKGLSGGERKRLAIAAELLLAPSIIFLDEPSSGLDSVMSESIFATMKDLTYQGRMVVASVHCPSSETVHSFSHLILLTCDGRLAYHGPGDKALAHFARLGYKCPMSYNPADWYLKQISVTPGADLDGEKQRMDMLVAAFEKSEWRTLVPLEPDEAHKKFRRVYGLKAGVFTLFKLNLWRSFIQFRRDWITFVLWGVVSGVIGGLFGILFWQQAAANWRNLLGLLFSVVVANLFTSSLAVMMRFPLDWGIVVREYYSGANAIGPYLTARFIMDAPLGYGPFILITLLYWMTGMDPDLMRFTVFALTFISSNWAAASMGQYVSSFSSNPFIGLTLLPGFVAPMIMFSGILYERQSVPVWLAWLERISLVNYAFGSLLAQQIHILPQSWAKYLLLFTQVDITKWQYNILMLWVMNFSFQVLTYFNLSLRLRFATAN